jgi:hypothetical protein
VYEAYKKEIVCVFFNPILQLSLSNLKKCDPLIMSSNNLLVTAQNANISLHPIPLCSTLLWFEDPILPGNLLLAIHLEMFR